MQQFFQHRVEQRRDPAPAETPGGDAFWRVERSGALLGLKLRVIGVIIIAAALSARTSGPTLAYYLGILAILLITGVVLYASVAWERLAHLRGVTLMKALIVALDMALITGAIVAPAPSVSPEWPAEMQMRIGTVGFLFVFQAFCVLSFSPALALWSGVAAAAAWFGGAIWLTFEPGAFTLAPSAFAAMEIPAIVQVLTDPHYVSIIGAAQEAVLLVVAGMILATAVWRGRVLALREVEATRQRTALLRYFSPDVAEELTREGHVFEGRETREAAILFADIVGFTGMAEEMTPDETIHFLREFHRRASGAVFAHRGTLNKFIGDEIMASFGAIHTLPEAPALALECAVAVAQRAAEWSEEREAAGLRPLRIGVGLHIGPVVVGDIGDDDCLELAVLGDAVNIANRLQEESRTHRACVVVSRAVLDAALCIRPDLSTIVEDFEPLPTAALRGRR
ncbi:MAG: adenylate/guanylate cyclase domain-containing protein, partial [Pseudomonadota bacterium]